MPLINRINQKKLTKGIITQIRQRYRSAYPQIKAAVKDVLNQEMTDAFYKNKTVDSCLQGVLRAELGLEAPAASMETILNKMKSVINIKVEAPRDQNGVLKISIEGIRDDLSELLALGAAEQDWTDRTGSQVRGEPLPWLEWLTVRGANVIIQDYIFNERTTYGRSGEKGLMIPREGKFWKVPRGYQGTITDNFIIDIVERAEINLRKKLWETVRPVIARLS